jgi:glycogen debranching enzyme
LPDHQIDGRGGIAAGFARYGRREDTARLFESRFAASTYVDLRTVPELICGFPRQRNRGPTFYPVACSPQAWAAATPLYLLQSCLGLSFEAEANRIIFRRPVQPGFLSEITLTGLSLPAGSGAARPTGVRRRSARPISRDRGSGQ